MVDTDPMQAYWVNYDIDVPLFLPLYGANRILDLQTMARLEIQRNTSVQGQNNFGSGWEWSYWRKSGLLLTIPALH